MSGVTNHTHSSSSVDLTTDLESSLFFIFNGYSSSVIANLNDNRSLHDVFYSPCSWNSFLPNQRLRELKESLQSLCACSEIEDLDYCLQQKLASLQTWKTPPKGSETVLLDPLVNKAILDEIVSWLKSPFISVSKDLPPEGKSYLCSTVKTEYRVEFNNSSFRYVLMASEAKGVDASHFNCMMQALEAASDASVYMRQKSSLPSKDCATPGILVYSDVIQFYGVYLVDDFPVTVLLSRPLCYTDVVDRRAIARGIFACAKYVAKTVDLLQVPGVLHGQENRLLFNFNSFFFKPIRTNPKRDLYDEMPVIAAGISNAKINVERVLNVYQAIYRCDEALAEQYVAMPLGVMCFSPRADH